MEFVRLAVVVIWAWRGLLVVEDVAGTLRIPVGVVVVDALSSISGSFHSNRRQFPTPACRCVGDAGEGLGGTPFPVERGEGTVACSGPCL